MAESLAVRDGAIGTVGSTNSTYPEGGRADLGVSFYFVTTTLSTVGYGDYSPSMQLYLLYNMPVLYLFQVVCQILFNMIRMLLHYMLRFIVGYQDTFFGNCFRRTDEIE
jgi:hypothetical protein